MKKKLTERQRGEKINAEGNLAAKKGLGVDANPHEKYSNEWYAWRCGWLLGYNQKLKISRQMQLEKFFERIATLTSNHDVIADHACVTARKLGEALETVDPMWWRDVTPMTKADKAAQINI